MLAAAPATVVGVAPYVRHPLTETVVGVVRYSSSEAKSSKRKKQKKRDKDAANRPESSNNPIPEGIPAQVGDVLESANNLLTDAASHPSTQDAPDFYTRPYIPSLSLSLEVTC